MVTIANDSPKLVAIRQIWHFQTNIGINVRFRIRLIKKFVDLMMGKHETNFFENYFSQADLEIVNQKYSKKCNPCKQLLSQAVAIGGFRPFYLPFENDALLSKDGVLGYQLLAAARDIRYGASAEDGRIWFGEFLDGFLELIEEEFAGVVESRKHNERNAILVGR